MVLTLALYSVLIGALQDRARELFLAYFQTWGWNPESWAAGLVLLFTKVLLFVIGGLTFSVVASIIASPFNDLLAEATEPWCVPRLPPVSETSWQDKLRLIGIDVTKSLAATVALILAVVTSWIPIVNAVSFAAAMLLMTFQFISYPQTRRGVRLRQGVAFLWRHLFACVGFGASLTFLFALPVISSVALPLAVVGGTLLVARAPGDHDQPPLK